MTEYKNKEEKDMNIEELRKELGIVRLDKELILKKSKYISIIFVCFLVLFSTLFLTYNNSISISNSTKAKKIEVLEDKLIKTQGDLYKATGGTYKLTEQQMEKYKLKENTILSREKELNNKK